MLCCQALLYWQCQVDHLDKMVPLVAVKHLQLGTSWIHFVPSLLISVMDIIFVATAELLQLNTVLKCVHRRLCLLPTHSLNQYPSRSTIFLFFAALFSFSICVERGSEESVTKDYQNFKFQQPYQQAMYYCSLILQDQT